MFCAKCGNQIEEGTVFCPQCGTKVETVTSTTEIQSEVIIKTKKECIIEAMSRYAASLSLGWTHKMPRQVELTTYEEGRDGMVYVEATVSYRNNFGATKTTKYGAVIKEVEADGNAIFKAPGPQLMGGLVGTGTVKRILGFKPI